MLGDFASDIRFAIRKLRRAPAFTAIVLVTLIAGVAAVTAIFSYANAAYFAALPYKDADRIVPIGITRSYNVPAASPTAVRLVRSASKSFERIAVFQTEYTSILIGEEARTATVLAVDTGFTTLMSLRPQLGRLPTREEIIANAPVAAISSKLWRAQFGADSAVLGKTISVLKRDWRIVGVLPEGFEYPYKTDLMTPMAEPPMAVPGSLEDEPDWTILGKLRPGVSREAAAAEMRVLTTRIPKYPRRVTWGASLYVMDEMLDRRAYQYLPMPMLFIGMGVFVLLIACANVGNLFLARGAERRGEIAVRASLGATRARLVREALAETLVVGVIAAVAGTALSSLLVKLALRALPTENWPSWFHVTLDWRVLAFALGSLLLVTIAVGLSPALEGTKLDLVRALKASGGASGATGRVVGSISRGLAAQLALAVALFVCSALLVRAYQRLAAVDLGYPAERIAKVQPWFDDVRYPDRWRRIPMLTEIAEGLRGVPGVAHTAVTGPVNEYRTATTIKRTMEEQARLTNDYRLIPDGDTVRGLRIRPEPRQFAVSDNYFAALGLRIREGRGFVPDDTENRAGVAVVSASLASRVWPRGSALDHTIQVGRAGERLTIVGVVDDINVVMGFGSSEGSTQATSPQLTIYATVRQAMSAYPILLATGDGDVSALRSLMLSRVRAADRGIPIGPDATMAADVERHMKVTRIFGGAIAFFAVVALMLSVIGIYGVVAFGVARRVREIGVRIALGGTARHVLLHVMGGTTKFMLVGLVLGLGLATVLGRFMTMMLFGVSPLDPVAYLAVCVLFAIVALLASYFPARRATRIDPLVALRAE